MPYDCSSPVKRFWPEVGFRLIALLRRTYAGRSWDPVRQLTSGGPAFCRRWRFPVTSLRLSRSKKAVHPQQATDSFPDFPFFICRCAERGR